MTVSKQLIQNIEELRKSLNEISVYDFDVYTSMELYYKIANKLNEVIKELMRFEGLVSDEVVEQNEKLIYLLGEGLNNEVIKKINQMVQDGTMDSIINHNLFNSLNNKVDEYKEELSSQIKDKVSKGEGGVITNAMLSQEVKESMTGGSVAVVGKNAILSENIVNNQIGLSKLSSDIAQTINGESVKALLTNTGLFENDAYKGWANAFKPLGFAFDRIKYKTKITDSVPLICQIRDKNLNILYSTTANATVGTNSEVIFIFDNYISLNDEFYVVIYPPSNTIKLSASNGRLNNNIISSLNHKGIFFTSSNDGLFDLETTKCYMDLEFIETKFESDKFVIKENSLGEKHIKDYIIEAKGTIIPTFKNIGLQENSSYCGWANKFTPLSFNKIFVYSNIDKPTTVTCNILDENFNNILYTKSTYVEVGDNVKIEFDFDDILSFDSDFYVCISADKNTSIISYNWNANATKDLLSSSPSSKGILKSSSNILNAIDLNPNDYLLAIEFNSVILKSNILRITKNQILDLYNTSTEIVLPSIVPVVKECEFNYYFDNAIMNNTIKSLLRVTASPNFSDYFTTEETFRFIPTSTMSTKDVTFSHYFLNTKDNAITKTVKYKVINKTVGDGLTKKCLFIGDSITQDGRYETELINLFSNDMANIELLGTRGTSPALHEGRGGWSSKDYCTLDKKGSTVNAFWNPTTSKFDFSYYMQQQGYTNVDYVFVMLGTNDLANKNVDTVSYFEEIVNSIKQFDNNIKVVINLHPPLSARVDRIALKNKRLDLHKLLIEKYDNRQDEGYFLLPTFMNIDPKWDFPYKVVKDSRHHNEFIEITDNTHFNDSGYNKIADTIYFMIKYLMSL